MNGNIWLKFNGRAFTPQGGSYPSANAPIIHLIFLLAEEIRVGDSMDWIGNPGYRSGNESYSYIEDGELIIQMDHFEDIPPFKINKNLFLKLVQAWMNIYPQYPNRIDLIQEDDKFTFEFDKKEGHQKIVVE